MKAFKMVILMCVALFVLCAAFGCVLGTPARCSEARPQTKRSARGADAPLARPSLPGLRYVTVAPLY
jgi:hypothetical protein